MMSIMRDVHIWNLEPAMSRALERLRETWHPRLTSEPARAWFRQLLRVAAKKSLTAGSGIEMS
jgi:hypothetical protein